MSYPGHTLAGNLFLCRDAIGVFYSPNRLGLVIMIIRLLSQHVHNIQTKDWMSFIPACVCQSPSAKRNLLSCISMTVSLKCIVSEINCSALFHEKDKRSFGNQNKNITVSKIFIHPKKMIPRLLRIWKEDPFYRLLPNFQTINLHKRFSQSYQRKVAIGKKRQWLITKKVINILPG